MLTHVEIAKMCGLRSRHVLAWNAGAFLQEVYHHNKHHHDKLGGLSFSFN